MTGAMRPVWVLNDQWAWVEERAHSLRITPSALIRALIETAMEDRSDTGSPAPS